MNGIDFKSPKIVLLIGRPKSGKSNAVKYEIIKNVKKKVWKHGLIFTGSAFNNKEYNYMPRENIIEGYNEGILKKYVESLKKYIKKNNKKLNVFILFDDLIGILNTRNNPYLINLISIHRHIGASILICAQYYKSSASSTIVRCCLNYGIFFRSIKSDVIKAIYDEYGTEFGDIEEFKKHYLLITEKPFTGMFYNQDADNREYFLKNNYHAIKYPDMSKSKIQLEFD